MVGWSVVGGFNKTFKFEGRNLDWLRFWSQFETKIYRTDETTLSKLSYLRKLVIPKVRALVDGLPFHTEVCERRETTLKAIFRKPSEETNVHIQCIISLQTITEFSV